MDIKKNEDRKKLLSILWIFAVLNYLYADVLTLMDPVQLNNVLNNTGPFQMNERFLLGAAALMETSIIMVVLSIILNRTANRIANIATGTIHTLSVFLSFFAGTPASYYLFHGIIEITCTLIIIWLAWTWPKEVKQ